LSLSRLYKEKSIWPKPINFSPAWLIILSGLFFILLSEKFIVWSLLNPKKIIFCVAFMSGELTAKK